MKLWFMLPLLTVLVGCSSVPRTDYRYKTVDVPVYTVPDIQIPPAPYLPVRDIKSTDTNEQVAKAYVTSILELQLYSDQLRSILEELTKTAR